MTKITDDLHKKILSGKIKALRNALNLTDKEFARLCGYSLTTIVRLEGRSKSDSAVNKKTLLDICRNTGADPDWLLDFDDDSVEPVWLVEKGQGRSTSDDAHNADHNAAFGERLRALRAEMRMSQVQFAELTGVSSGNIASIETGRSRLTEQTARKIENVCVNGGGIAVG